MIQHGIINEDGTVSFGRRTMAREDYNRIMALPEKGGTRDQAFRDWRDANPQKPDPNNNLRFQVGDEVQHKLSDYWGVICGATKEHGFLKVGVTTVPESAEIPEETKWIDQDELSLVERKNSRQKGNS